MGDVLQSIGSTLVGSLSFITEDESGNLLVFGRYPEALAIQAAYFLIVVLIALVVQHALGKLIRKLLANVGSLPTATIIVNIMRAVVWSLALICVLEPVFGVKPTAFVTALGVGSVVISLGLKDTVSNAFGGLALMVGRVVQPGDYVTVSGVTGTVVDVTMRHTVVENRLDERVVIPNSVLNTTSIQRLPASSESMGTFEFTMEAGYDPDVVAADMVAAIKAAGAEVLREDMEPKVMFDSVTPYGVKGQVFFYVKEGVPFAGVRDTLVRSVARKDYFSLSGARSLVDVGCVEGAGGDGDGAQ